VSQDDLALEEGYQAKRRSVPRVLVAGLCIVTILYALILTFVLPWALLEAVLRTDLPAGWSLAAAVFGLLFMFRWCAVHALAFRAHINALGRVPKILDHYPIVSILVPAHNESESIISAIRSLISLDYPRYEVIVIDDGSTDDTYEKALPWAGKYDRCTVAVIRKPNGGKWSALNLAYKRSKGELILCVDADSRLGEDALLWLVPRLFEPGVVAACGQVTIRNRETLLARFQALEYLISNGGMRTALSVIGQVTLVPGPIGLYKREILELVAKANWHPQGEDDEGKVFGPLSDSTFAEDFELSLSALALGGRIVYEPSANAYTKCPDDIGTLISQRYRWIRGTWQVCRIYRREMSKVARNTNKWLTPAMWALYPLDLYFVPLLQLSLVAILGIALIAGYPMALVFYSIGAVALLNAMTAAVFVVSHDDEFEILPLVLGLDFYSMFVRFAWIIAGIDELRRTGMRWHAH
jgi:poly-beta-1,6-N-acetyl-D-glucosamine synthase